MYEEFHVNSIKFFANVLDLPTSRWNLEMSQITIGFQSSGLSPLRSVSLDKMAALKCLLYGLVPCCGPIPPQIMPSLSSTPKSLRISQPGVGNSKITQI